MKSKFIIIVLVVIAIGIFFLGQTIGKKTAQTKFQAQAQQMKTLIDAVYPPPPAEMYSLTGAVKEIYGASITMEISSLDDYLPHLDGAARKTETRIANVMASTIYTLFDYTQFDKQGNPKTTAIGLKDLKAGDNITVRSEQNIKSAKSFDAIEIQKANF